MTTIAGMRHLGKIFRDLRESKGWTLEYVANQIPDYDSGNLSRFERQKQDIAPAKLEALAQVLGVKLSEVMLRAESDRVRVSDVQTPPDSGVISTSSPSLGGYADEHAASYIARLGNLKSQRVPVLSDEEASSLVDSPLALTTATEMIDAPEELGPGGFGWRVPDDSMTAPHGPLSFAPGMIVMFKQAMAHHAGDCVLVALAPGEVAFTQLSRPGGVWHMTPLNPRYSPVQLPSDAKVLGVAVAGVFIIPRGPR